MVRSGAKIIFPTTSRQSKLVAKKCARREDTVPSTTSRQNTSSSFILSGDLFSPFNAKRSRRSPPVSHIFDMVCDSSEDEDLLWDTHQFKTFISKIPIRIK